MSTVKLILKEDVEALGKAGELVTVRPGYARNYLIPKGTAVLATLQNLLWLKKHKQTLEQQSKERKAESQSQKEILENLSEIQIEAQVGPTGKLFGRVTNKILAERIEELTKGKLILSHQQIKIDGYLHGIDETGSYKAHVDFGYGIKADLMVQVVEAQA